MHTLTPRVRALRALVSALVVIAVALVVAPRALADQQVGNGWAACNYDGRTFHACHILGRSSSFFFMDDTAWVHLNMPEQHARDIINCPGSFFNASLYGNDGHNGIDSEDDFIRDLQLDPGWPRADGSGLEAHFTTRLLSGTNLNEDDGTDELYVKFTYWDCYSRLTNTIQSDDEVGELWNGRT